MHILLDKSVEGYRKFLRIKSLPVYHLQGRLAYVPDEYAGLLGEAAIACPSSDYSPLECAFDYQSAIVRLALRKRKFAIFADCGLGKSLMYFEYLRAVQAAQPFVGSLIITPAMVVPQLCDEAARFYGDSLPVEEVYSGDVATWLKSCGGKIGVTNWEALQNDLTRGQLGALILDESSMLKSHYGSYGNAAIALGRGLHWKLAGTGTPAPNDRIEYANHAVFMDRFPTVNAFLAKYFVNRGETQERWVLKPHALRPFYREIGDWSIFLSDPSVYGWKDNATSIPPIHVHVHDVDMTSEQRSEMQQTTGQMFVSTRSIGGITARSKLSRLAKGLDGTPTLKYDAIASLIASWPDESTIIWCWYNDEQDRLAGMFPDAANIDGSTKHDKRLELIADFKAGRRRILISKPKILGFGLNLQVATRQVFSSLIDSYEQYYQAIKRSNRVGSTRPLNVHIPMTDLERPMVENVLRKAHMVQQDTAEQSSLFRELTR